MSEYLRFAYNLGKEIRVDEDGFIHLFELLFVAQGIQKFLISLRKRV